jgi:hypothetical protein
LNVDSGSDDDESSMIGGGARRRGVPAISVGGAVSIFYYAGLVAKNEIGTLKRLLFRATKGKVLTKVCEDAVVDYSLGQLDSAAESNPVPKAPGVTKDSKCVYVLVFQD